MVTSLAITSHEGHFLSLKGLALMESVYNPPCQSSIIIPHLVSSFLIQDKTRTHLKWQLPATLVGQENVEYFVRGLDGSTDKLWRATKQAE